MKKIPFNRKEHVYRNDAFAELVKDAIRFFSGTPAHRLPPPEPFSGTGVYALYYVGNCKNYEKYAALNRLSYSHPIYVGKAVPSGWRQNRVSDDPLRQANELYNRLRQHATSINVVSGLNSDDFMCRFVIFENAGSDMIGTIEAALIKLHNPLWNTTVDGFGNHDPGRGRYEQAKSDWDVIHQGRKWADKCNGKPNPKESILKAMSAHFKKLEK